jgi:hypothetical protein
LLKFLSNDCYAIEWKNLTFFWAKLKLNMKMFLPRVLLVCTVFFIGQKSAAQTDVLMQHNDLSRTGWNSTETQLNVNNVSPTSFGLLFKQAVDDQIYAQPLVVTGVNIGGGTKNVVYVCTLNNSIYAFDADNGSIQAYWTINLTPTGVGLRPPANSDMHTPCIPYVDFTPSPGKPTSHIGIVGTPVIDKSSNTLYVVSRYVDASLIDNSSAYLPTGFHEVLHAIDLSTGADKIAPTDIQATASGTAPGNNAGIISFDTRRQNQRGGLLLMNGVIYIPFAAHCDWDNYHGWLLAYNAATLQQLSVFISSPNDGRGGIWMSGAAPAAENIGNGNIYLATGNSYNANPSILQNRGESIVKLIPDAPGIAQTQLDIADYFTPYDYGTLNSADQDFGSQILVIPNTQLLVTGCKDYNMYVLSKTNLGKFDSTNNIVQKYLVGTNAAFHSSLAYFGGLHKKFVYEFAEQQSLSAFPVTPDSIAFHSPVIGNVQGGNGACGSYMSVSSNGNDESTGVLWITNSANAGCNANQSLCPGVLNAVNASDVTKLLWSSQTNPTDAVGTFAKTACPTIANGKVYLATFSNNLNVYGVLASNPLCVTNVALNQPAVATSPATGTTHDASKAFDGNAGTEWISNASDPQSIYVDLGKSYDMCKVSISWDANAFASEYYLETTQQDPVAFPNSWTAVTHVTGNTSSSTDFVGTFSGRYVQMRGVTRSQGTTYSISEMQVFGQPSITCAAPSNLVSSSITQNTAHLSWDAVPSATGYNVTYNNSAIVSQISRNNLTTNSLDLSALSCGTSYNYYVQTICSGGQLSAFTPLTKFNTTGCTAPCGALPTRYFSADIGDIGVAGSTCYTAIDQNHGTFTMMGSGQDVGGVNDEYQMMYFGLTGDDTYQVEITSQDAVNPNNKAGAIMKQSLSSTAPFAFVGVTSQSGAFFMYRITDGGNAVTTFLPGIKAPYYLQLQKTGTQYAGFVSPTGTAGTWVQIGTTIDLGFGSSSIYEGLAVTSDDNTLLSTAVFDNTLSSSPLPITLVSFTAQNINNQYVSLHWTTAMEENNDHFTIERSSDGMHFDLITTQKAVGNSTINQNYSYSDMSPVNGVNFYRLRQFDIDGRTAEFPVVQVEFGLDGLPVVYPNPVIQTVNIASGKELVSSVRLISMDGKEIMNVDNSAGLQVIKLNLATLSGGVYMLELKTYSKTYHQKILKE